MYEKIKISRQINGDDHKENFTNTDCWQQSFWRELRRVGWEHKRFPWDGDWQGEDEPTLGREVDGMDCRLDRLKAIGNGQVPAVAALAWETLRLNRNES